MTDRTPKQIEREIEEERSALASSLEDLQEQFSPERILNTVTAQVRENGGEFASQLGRAVKDNPIGLLVAGVGIAMLMSGTKSRSTSGASDAYDDAPAYTPRTAHRTVSSPALTRGPVPTGHSAHPVNSYDTHEDGPSAWDDMKSKADEWMNSAQDYIDDATSDAAQTRDQLAWNARAKHAQAKSKAAYYKARAQSKVAQLRQSLNSGTEDMSDAARARVAQARNAAISAAEEAERHYHKAHRAAANTYYENPILMGLGAAAVGAALGAALPRTQTEDAYFGERRDALLDEATRIYAEESRKLKEVARAASAEAKAAISEKVSGARSQAKGKVDGKAAVDAAESAASDIVQRTAKAGQKEADKQNVGGSFKS